MTKALGLYFEVHITIDPRDHAAALTAVGTRGWHYSALKGDEVLGPDVRGYLTLRATSLRDAYTTLHEACLLLAGSNVPWVRRKVEVALLDEVLR